MITQLTQEAVTEYASDAQTIQEPQGADYSQGVKVGRTVPAKWWNWLFRAATKRLGQSRTDAQNMLTELQNVVTDAGITLDGSDSTQLEQAVVAKANAQVNAYVEAKKGFMTLWGSRPMPSTLADYSNVTLMTQCNGLNIIMARNSDSSKACVAVSLDMVNWRIVREVSASSGDVMGAICGCVYFNENYYLVFDVHTSYLIGLQNVYVLKSNDGLSWTAVLSDSKSEYSGLEGVFLGVISGKLYLYYRDRSYNVPIKRLNDTETAFVDTSMICAFAAGVYSSSYNGYHLAYPTIQLGSDKYIIGNHIITANETITEITQANNVRYGVSIRNANYQQVSDTGTNIRKLINGYVAFLGLNSNTSTVAFTLCDTTGNVVGSTSFSANILYTVYTSPEFPTLLLTRQVYQGNTYIYYYSPDSTTLTYRVPFAGAEITQIGDTFYVAYTDTDEHTRTLIYKIESSLSPSASDYTLISQITHINMARVAGLHYGGIPGCLICEQGGMFWVSLDSGLTWKPSTTPMGQAFAGFAFVISGGTAFTLPDSSAQLCKCSENAVNRVLGHTLYLR